MSSWTPDELSRIGAAEELEIAARGSDGSLRAAVPIWVVRVGDDLYIRSWRGPNGRWFRVARATRAAHISAGGVDRDVALIDAEDEVNDAIDDGYRAKYGRYATYVPPMLAAQARATTLKLVAQHHSGGS